MLAFATDARAWACADEPPAKLASKAVPRNAALRVRFPRQHMEPRFVPEFAIEAGKQRIAVRVIALPRQQALVSPLQPLLAGTRYRLVWTMSKEAKRIYGTPTFVGSGAQRDEQERAFAATGRFEVGEFETTDYIDSQPPRWTTPPKAVYVDVGSFWWHPKTDAPGYVPPIRVRAWPQGYVDVSAARDDRTQRQDLLFLAWVVDPNPRVVTPSGKFSGDAHIASSNVFVIGDKSRMSDCAKMWQATFPAKVRQIPMAVIAVDAAGNSSTPHYFVLNRLKRLAKAPRW